MNPENGGNAVRNSGEGGEKIVKPETIKELGDRTVDLEGYLAEDEQKANEAKEKAEQEQNANKSKIAELKAQMDALVAEQAKLAEQQRQHEVEIQKIVQQRQEKAQAMKSGIKGMAKWYDQHPNEIGDIIRPEMGHDADYYIKWQQETGQSFATIIADSVLIDELSQREDLKGITPEEIEKETIALERKKVDLENYKALMARRNGDMSAKFNNELVLDEDGLPGYGIIDRTKGNAPKEEAPKATKPESVEDFSKSMLGQIDELMNDSEKAENSSIEEKAENAIKQAREFAEYRNRSIFEHMMENGSTGSSIDRAIGEQKFRTKESKITRLDDACRNKYALKKAAASAVIGVMALLGLSGLASTLQGCSKNLNSYPMGATPVEGTAVAGATEEAEPEAPAGPVQEQGWMSKSGEQGETQRPEYKANYFTMDQEGNKHDMSEDLYRKVDFKAENPFDYEVKEKGEKLTADKKETKASFGTTLTPNGLEGGIDVAEQEFNKNLMSRASSQEELAISLLAGIGGSDALKDVDFSTGNDIDVPAKLEVANGNISPEAVNRDSRILAALPEAQQQKIMNALSEGWQKLIEDKEFSLVNWKGTYSSQTMKPAKDGEIAHDIVIQDGVKRSAEFAVYQVNDDATKLTVLQTMGKINSDVTLEQAQAKGLLKNWEVGLKADCGGQWVAKKKVVKKVVKKAPAPEQVVVPVAPVVETPVITWETPTPTNPEPETPPAPETPPEKPTPVIVPDPTPPPTPPTPPPTPPTPEPTPTPTPDPEPTPQPKDPSIDPWKENNPTPLPVTPEQPSDPGQTPIQKGGETPPPKNEEGVNEKPEDQAPWAEPPTPKPEDTNTGGEGEQQPGAMDEAIRRLQGNQ